MKYTNSEFRLIRKIIKLIQNNTTNQTSDKSEFIYKKKTFLLINNKRNIILYHTHDQQIRRLCFHNFEYENIHISFYKDMNDRYKNEIKFKIPDNIQDYDDMELLLVLSKNLTDEYLLKEFYE